MNHKALPWYQRLHWVNVFFLILTPLGAAILLPLHTYFVGFSGKTLAIFFFYCACTSMSITAGYHRFIAHRSYACHPVLKLFYLLFGAAAFQGSALQWGTDHRRHHRCVDTDSDPHNIRRGFWWAHVGWLLIKDESKYHNQFERDLLRDPWIVWQHRYFVPIAIAMGFGFPMFVGWCVGNPVGGLLWGGLLRVVVTNHYTFLINSLAHTVGSKPYSDKQTARDSLLMAVLAFGEGYHNYHHQFASDYRNGIRWYHWDPTKWLIRVMSWVGLAYRLKLVPQAEILRARLRTEQARLMQRGAPADRLNALKNKVEEAQNRWRLLRADYVMLKKNMKDQSRAKLIQLKAEIRVAKLEFKMAYRQWGAYYRTMRALPAIS